MATPVFECSTATVLHFRVERTGTAAGRPHWTRIVAVTLAFAVGPLIGWGALQGADAKAPKPNIIVIVADDLGWGHVGWQRPAVLTPHLDRLAKGGVRLDRHYVAPVCSPTRVAFMTGRCWSRFGCNTPLPSEPDSKARVLPPGTETIASSLKAAGYRTALVGKWHLGAAVEDGPERFGFDYFYGLRIGGMTPLTHRWLGLGGSVLWRNDRVVEEPGHVTALLAREAVRWIGSPGEGPFFLYLAFTSPHVPLQESERWMNLYKDTAPDRSHQLYWAAISHLDDAVGQVMAEVDRLGQRDNTLVVFFSDNGAPGQPNRMQAKADIDSYLNVILPGDNPPFRGKKGDVYEGGIRVPALAFWPGHLRPGVCDEFLHVTDWMPTLCALVGYRPTRDLKWDGRDAWPAISRGEALAATAPRALYFKGPQQQQTALRQGDWKLIRHPKNKPELYNLSVDMAEATNRAGDEPETLERMRALLEAESGQGQRRHSSSPQTMNNPIKHRCLIFLAALLLAPQCASRAADPPKPQRRPNILWIVGENFSNDLACYGQKNVATPNLDALAKAGIRYTHAFSTSPVCAPSRSCFMLGMYQTTTDTHHMRSHRNDDFELPPGIRPLPHRLKDAGYFTANITHLGQEVMGTGKLDLNFVNEGRLYDTAQWDDLKTNQPFFAQINLPEAEYDIYDRKSAEKERVPWVGEEWHPKVATEQNVTPPPYYPDHPIVRQEWARYLNSVSGADVRVGKILARLKQDGLDNDTVVIFFADNGRLTARGIHWPFDPGLRVPIIVRDARNFPILAKAEKPGVVSDRLVSLIDLTATTLWIAGLERPFGMQSRVFLGLDADPPRAFAFAARDRIDETVVRMRSVHEQRYHYIRNFTPGAGFETLNRYKEKCFLVKPLMRKLKAEGKLSGPALELMKPFPDEMLYDTRTDPHEIRNLADSSDPEHRTALLRMRAALDAWMVETGDRGHLPEPPEVVAPFVKEMDAWFGTPEWAKDPK